MATPQKHCTKCGKPGHLEKDCYSGKTFPPCEHCGYTNHPANKCKRRSSSGQGMLTAASGSRKLEATVSGSVKFTATVSGSGTLTSTTSGQGIPSDISCNCFRTACTDNRCTCKKNGKKCGPLCHEGKGNCQNLGQNTPELELSFAELKIKK